MEKSFQRHEVNNFTTTMECCVLKLSKGITKETIRGCLPVIVFG